MAKNLKKIVLEGAKITLLTAICFIGIGSWINQKATKKYEAKERQEIKQEIRYLQSLTISDINHKEVEGNVEVLDINYDGEPDKFILERNGEYSIIITWKPRPITTPADYKELGI